MANVAHLRWALAILLIICLVLLIISTATTHWIHYQKGNDKYVYGLWQICKYTKGVIDECFSTRKHTGDLIIIKDDAARMLLVFSAVFLGLAVVCVFMIVNEFCKVCSTISYCWCILAATVLAWSGIGTFITPINENSTLSNIKYEWSFVLAICVTVVITLMLPLSVCLHIMEVRDKSHDDKKYLKKSFQETEHTRKMDAVIEEGYDDVDIKEAPEDNRHDVPMTEGDAVLTSFAKIDDLPTAKDNVACDSDSVVDEQVKDPVITIGEEQTHDGHNGFSKDTLQSTEVTISDLRAYLDSNTHADSEDAYETVDFTPPIPTAYQGADVSSSSDVKADNDVAINIVVVDESVEPEEPTVAVDNKVGDGYICIGEDHGNQVSEPTNTAQ